MRDGQPASLPCNVIVIFSPSAFSPRPFFPTTYSVDSRFQSRGHDLGHRRRRLPLHEAVKSQSSLNYQSDDDRGSRKHLLRSGNISITAVVVVVYLLRRAGGRAGGQASLSLHRRSAVVSAAASV